MDKHLTMNTQERIADLKAKLAAREGHSEFKENVKAIRDEIARLEAAG